MTDRPRARRSAPRPEIRSDKPPVPPALALRAQSRQWRALGDLPALRAHATEAIEAALAVAPVKPLPGAELSLLLTDDRRIRIVNRDWRGFDKATNVLSFPAAPADRIGASPVLGDIVIAYETVAREAEAEGKAIADHFSHLVIHGLLHLKLLLTPTALPLRKHHSRRRGCLRPGMDTCPFRQPTRTAATKTTISTFEATPSM